MNEPLIIQAKIHEDSTFVVMARMMDETNDEIVQADVSTITYTVSDATNNNAAVSGHSAASLTVSSVVFDTLQTGNGWSEDGTGYNFRHVVGPTALPTGGNQYIYEAVVTLTSGNKFPIVVHIEAVDLARS